MLLVAFCLPYKGDIGGYEVKGYLLTDQDTTHTFKIDTGYNAQQMMATIKERGLTLIGVGLTHEHANHAGGLDTILAEWPVFVCLGSGNAGEQAHNPFR